MKEKIEKYFNLLHPEYETLTLEEQYKLRDDRDFITDNIYEIDNMYNDLYESGRNQSNMIPLIISLLKTENYLGILYPEYKTLSKKEQLNSRYVYDEGIISENIEEIDEMYRTAISEAERKGQDVDKQKIIATAVNQKKADKYFALLHPDFKTLESLEHLEASRDRSFIEEHIEEIDKYYQEGMQPNSGEQQIGLSEQKIISLAVKAAKAEEYLYILHPEYKSEILSDEEIYYETSEKVFIRNHIDEIDEMYRTAISEAERKGEDVDEQNIMATAVNQKKADKYFVLLYPDFKTLESAEKLKASKDRSFIEEHIDEIDKYYKDHMHTDSLAQQHGWSEQKIISLAVKAAKAEEYLYILHPEYKSEILSDEEMDYEISEKLFIRNHIDEIDQMYRTAISKAERKGQDVDKQKIIATAVNLKKVDEYFTLLHPDFKTLESTEQFRLIGDRSFIEEHIEEIDKKYHSFICKRNESRRDNAINNVSI